MIAEDLEEIKDYFKRKEMEPKDLGDEADKKDRT